MNTHADENGALGAHWRGAVDGPVDVRSGGERVTSPVDEEVVDPAALDDVALGAHLWSQASRAASLGKR